MDFERREKDEESKWTSWPDPDPRPSWIGPLEALHPGARFAMGDIAAARHWWRLKARRDRIHAGALRASTAGGTCVAWASAVAAGRDATAFVTAALAVGLLVILGHQAGRRARRLRQRDEERSMLSSALMTSRGEIWLARKTPNGIVSMERIEGGTPGESRIAYDEAEAFTDIDLTIDDGTIETIPWVRMNGDVRETLYAHGTSKGALGTFKILAAEERE